MCVGSGTAGAGSHLTGPARTRPFLEEDLAGGDEGLLAAAVDLELELADSLFGSRFGLVALVVTLVF